MNTMTLTEIRDLLEGAQTSGNLSRVILHVTRVRQAIAGLNAYLTSQEAKGDAVDGWLVVNGSNTAWRYVGSTIGWTDHPDGAIQFARREDAEAFAAEDEDVYFIKRRSDYVCKLPPGGWYCHRVCGHEGPCAAERISDIDLSDNSASGYIALLARSKENNRA